MSRRLRSGELLRPLPSDRRVFRFAHKSRAQDYKLPVAGVSRYYIHLIDNYFIETILCLDEVCA